MYTPIFSIQGLLPGFRTDIFIRHGAIGSWASLTSLGSASKRLFLISDRTVDTLYGNLFREGCLGAYSRVDQFTCDPGEKSKSLDMAREIYEALSDAAFPRDGLIVALGGGVVGDLAGFVAATWMRGVRWVHHPTTMEAVLDSCIGGKTAVNLSWGKNLVGAFHHPTAVVIDPDVLSTLPMRDIRAGLAEAIKHAALMSNEQLAWLATNEKDVLSLDPPTVSELIERNLRFKASIVQNDPEERIGRRIVLNFGHTIGHAIESMAGGQLRHGECVALGMIAESRIAERLGLLGTAESSQLQDLIAQYALPCRIESVADPEDIWKAMQVDKKNTSGTHRMVLLKGIGQPVVWEDVSQELVSHAVASLS